jgi:ABC-type polar amino acid transport system ATPase subunit
MIEVRNLVKDHGALRVLNGVSLNINRGQVAVVVGPSGGGKSTLLRCINGLETFQAGEVRVGEIVCCAGPLGPEQERGLRALRRRVGMVFQQFHLFPHMSVLGNVMAGPLYVQGVAPDEATETARTLLDRVGMLEKANARPDELSGGQQQRVAIARALAMRPEAILFDEPTSALDPRMAGEVLKVIAELAAGGQTMVVVTHAMEFARRVAHTVFVMDAGQVVESGPPAEVLEQPRQAATRAFLAQVASA